ncbi:MAG: TonB-dependent receptor [Bacteroidales bacterium]|nr:TonB-dependent receptor [Bacteroidales bacterium]
MIKNLLLILLLMLVQSSFAQMISDTLDLDMVEITGFKHEQATGFKEVVLEKKLISEHVSGNLATLLISTSPVFIRSYVPGGLATASVRGASASQTQVIWNGLNINSPMHGQADFSLVPVFFVDRVSLLFGAGSALQTSGGLGGSVNLATETNWENHISVDLMAEAGSFDTYKTFGMVNIGNQKIQSSTRFFYEQSENDYSYHNNSISNENPPEEKRSHAAYSQKGLLQELSWKATDRTTASAKVWLQDNSRNIPPNILVKSPENNESLDEQFARAVVGTEHRFRNSQLDFQSGMLHSFSNYRNQLAGINTENRVLSSVNRFSYSFYGLKKLFITTGASFDYHVADAESYQGKKSRNEGAIYATAKYDLGEKLTLNLLIRQEFIDHEIAPFVPSFAALYRLSAQSPFSARVNLARNFRAPSLNDLYWTPGGNPDLKYEEGLALEGGLLFRKKISSFNISGEINGFYSDINNWIAWQPDSIFSFWSPSNLKNVVSKGIETSVDASGNFNKVSWSYLLNYTYTSARNMKPTATHDHSVGKQLIYVPENSVNQSIRLTFNGFTAGYVLTYAGKRFTTADNSRYLPGFVLQDIILSKTFKINRSGFYAQFTMNNLADQQYQAIAWQPMPGRNFSFSLKYRFEKINR